MSSAPTRVRQAGGVMSSVTCLLTTLSLLTSVAFLVKVGLALIH
jgi:hypothetical protein